MTVEEIVRAVQELFPIKNLYGIRNKKTSKFIAIGIIDQSIIFGEPLSIKGAKFWESKETAKYFLDSFLSDFDAEYFVDKCTENELNDLYFF